ncbi:hypothetical protein [Streptomyces sp. V3I7]|uniref:Mu transposase domain-containing protein n=1 Tax=Streptomyces sp. V3I7 TaxID=3042278 RepID=UPI0027884097|nr:hypothetical protein [Streptomyces sp. V3I7]MDQ0988849.1 hypothetical protein [Streptomyces sp. V3I7]
MWCWPTAATTTTSTADIRVDTCDYSVQPLAIDKKVQVRTDTDEVIVTLTPGGAEVARHPRCWAKQQTITDPVHARAGALLRGNYRHHQATQALAARQQRAVWHRMRTGTGQKGVHDYDWAMIEVTADDTPDGHDAGTSVLLVRRHRYTRTVSYYRCFAPGPVTLARLVSLVCRRWRVEDDFQDAKEICHLDKGQVTCWNSWHRWSVIALVAYAFLAVAAALERAAQTVRNDPAEADLVRPQQPRTPPPAMGLEPSAAPTRPRAPAVVVHLAPTPPTPRPPLPPPLARVRRHHTMIRQHTGSYLQLP